MNIENGTYIYANADIQAIQAKKERISPLRNIMVDYGSDYDLGEMINVNQKVLKIYGDLDNDNGFEPITFPQTKLIGKATGKTITINGQLYYEVVIDMAFGIQKRTRHYNWLNIEQAGTYEPFSTEGWFLDSDITDSLEKSKATAAAKESLLPSKTTPTGATAALPGTTNKNNTILVIVGASIAIVLTLILTLGKKKK